MTFWHILCLIWCASALGAGMMMTDAETRDEFVDGAQAARRDQPFTQWQSKFWKQGWTFEKRRMAAASMGRAAFAETTDAIERLAAACKYIASADAVRGEHHAVDLAIAVALQTLEGDDVTFAPAPIVDQAAPGGAPIAILSPAAPINLGALPKW